MFVLFIAFFSETRAKLVTVLVISTKLVQLTQSQYHTESYGRKPATGLRFTCMETGEAFQDRLGKFHESINITAASETEHSGRGSEQLQSCLSEALSLNRSILCLVKESGLGHSCVYVLGLNSAMLQKHDKRRYIYWFL